MPDRLDQEAYQRRLDRLTGLFGSMMETVEEQTQKRCPYKNRHGRCTANFGCRNQRKPLDEDGRFLCAGDDKLDYRRAWETN